MSGDVSDVKASTPKACRQDKWELVAEGDWLAGQRFEIPRHAVLGRDSSCDITIPGTHLSRRHAELAVNGDTLLIRDLNSSNGTFVNNQRVTETALKPGDSVRFDVLYFKVCGPGAESPPADIAPARIQQGAANRQSMAKKPGVPKASPVEKKWKTKPTAVGNRHQTVHFSTSQKATSYLWTVLAVLLGLSAVAGLGYLLTYL